MNNEEKNVTKEELIRRTAKATGYPIRESRAVINKFIELIGQDLLEQKVISLYGLGEFSVSTRKNPKPIFNESKATEKQKISNTPNTGKQINFRAGVNLKNKLNNRRLK